MCIMRSGGVCSSQRRQKGVRWSLKTVSGATTKTKLQRWVMVIRAFVHQLGADTVVCVCVCVCGLGRRTMPTTYFHLAASCCIETPAAVETLFCLRSPSSCSNCGESSPAWLCRRSRPPLPTLWATGPAGTAPRWRPVRGSDAWWVWADGPQSCRLRMGER